MGSIWATLTSSPAKLLIVSIESQSGDSYAIVTTSANGLIRLHDRMPVILAPDDYEKWLEPSELPKALLKPYPADRMTGWRVTDEARNPRAGNVPRRIERVGEVWRGMISAARSAPVMLPRSPCFPFRA